MIPKILHFVWVGSSKGTFPLPYYAARNIAAWRDAQPDYQIMFWQNNDVVLPDADQEWAYRNGRNAGETSDVVRHNVLYDFGGYSMDLDIMPAAGMGCLDAQYAAFAETQGREATSLALSDGSRVLGSAPRSALITEMRRRLPGVIAHAQEHHPDLRVAFTGWSLIQKCLADGFGGETMTLPGRCFPTAGQEQEDAIGIHDFAAEWVKQIA